MNKVVCRKTGNPHHHGFQVLPGIANVKSNTCDAAMARVIVRMSAASLTGPESPPNRDSAALQI